MSQKRRPAPSLQGRPSTTDQFTSSAIDFDIAKRVADQVDWSIWRALYAGEFRLAVPCRRCGRWLVDGRSKRRHYGPRCAALAAEAVTQ
jgi:hypothetical protein